ncbi:PucR family transcriptional regulator [Saccharopolyspora karakumensis]|nr:helix-turn-helix domain-containing protein [Saccharopolyspora karakumensis]
MDTEARDQGPDLSPITESAGQMAGVSTRYLDGYPEMLAAVLSSGRRLTGDELASRREAGRQAAEHGVALRSLLDLYLGGTRMVWRELATPGTAAATVLVEACFQAASDAVVALAEGYDTAHHIALRQEEAGRREFIDDLFSERSDLGRLAERAQHFGLRLAEAHIVTVAKADEPFGEATPASRTVSATMTNRFREHDLLIITKDERLVCVAPSSLPEASTEFAQQVTSTGPRNCRVGVGRAHRGPRGVLRSFGEACRSIDLAERLGHADRVVEATDFLVFEVLLRDRAAMSDLIATVLGPLHNTRGGAAPLVETLDAYFSHGTVPGAARALHLSTRAVVYRLERVSKLTGYSATDPGQRFTLEAAVLGARLLDWPAHPLTPSG